MEFLCKKKDSTYLVKVIDHPRKEHSIEEFELVHIRSLENPSTVAPNNQVQVDISRFYFTNDRIHQKGFGTFLEEFLGIGYSNVIYYDGRACREFAEVLAFANGINLDRKRKQLFVAASRNFKVHVFDFQDNGDLTPLPEIYRKMGVGNIEIDQAGNLWAAGHPNLLVCQDYAQRKRETSPSEIMEITLDPGNELQKQSVHLEDGSIISGSTVACPFGDLLLIGSALDDQLVILDNFSR